MKRPALLLPVLVSAAALTLAGCSADADAGAGAGASGSAGTSGLKVVATTTQVADFTRAVAGDDANVTQLIQPNQSAHSYDPSAADLAALGGADVLVINGAGLEEWLDDAITASGFDGLTIDASTGIELSDDEAGDDADHSDSDHSDAEHTDSEHSDSEHSDSDHTDAEHSDEGHAHEEGNPHIWTDPRRAAQMVATIESGLAEADESAASEFTANADAFEAELAELDTWIRDNVDQVPVADRLLVSNHDAFTYFVDAYGITYVGSVIPSFDDNAEPSAAQIDALVAAIEATGVKAVFSEASISPKAADTIASEAGVTVYSGDEALYGDSLGPAGSDGATYIDSQVHNVTLILESWGVTPSALPADLED